jgi:protein NRD1
MTNPHSVLNQNAGPHAPPSVDKAGMPSNAQAVNAFAGNLSPFGMSNGAMNPGQNQIPNQNLFQNLVNGVQNPLASLMSQAAAPDPQLQQVQVLQYLIAQGIPQDQWAPVLQALAASSGNPNVLGLNASVGSAPNYGVAQTSWGGNNEPGSRDADGRRDYGRSPPQQYGRRRSRSPGWERRREPSPPGRRGSPVYGDYSGDSPGRNRDGRGRGGQREYRQRSPPGRRRRSPSPPKDDKLPPPGPKHIEYDYSIGQGNIKGKSNMILRLPRFLLETQDIYTCL